MPFQTPGNGHGGTDPWDLEQLAAVPGARIFVKTNLRLPIKCYADLATMISTQKLTGRLFVDFSQGTAAFVTWEGST